MSNFLEQKQSVWTDKPPKKKKIKKIQIQNDFFFVRLQELPEQTVSLELIECLTFHTREKTMSFRINSLELIFSRNTLIKWKKDHLGSSDSPEWLLLSTFLHYIFILCII